MSQDNKRSNSSVLASLSRRERILVQEIAAGKSYTRAMRTAGYSLSTACKQQARTRNKKRIKLALLEVWFKKGLYLTDEELALIGKRREESR